VIKLQENNNQIRLPFKPPILVLILVGVGFAINYAFPISVLEQGYLRAILGLPCIFIGVLLMASARRTFSSHDEHFSHNVPTNKVVTNGPFRYTRNPVYLAMGFIVAGVAIIVNNAWLFITFHILGYPILHYLVVLPEEEYLKQTIGEAYNEYMDKVRRWI